MSEDTTADTNSAEHVESEADLIPDTFSDNLIAGFAGAPARFAGSIGGKLRAFGPWLLRGGSSFRAFFKEPGPKFRSFYTKLRKELDTLTSVQLIAVLFTFTLFLVLPLISVVMYSFTDPYTGLPSLVHFQSLFSDSNIWPWYYDVGTEQWLF
ncbi:MAG: hypothetical protein ACFFEV_03640, partial [Candidatus Thorarchaeota archaeon]